MLTLELIQRTNIENFEYTVGYLGHNHDLVPEFRDAGARVLCFNSNTNHTHIPQLDPSVIPTFLNRMRKEQFDILHAHMPYMQLLARLAANTFNDSQVISTQHTPRGALPIISRTLISLTQSLDSATVAVSKGVKQSFANSDTPLELRRQDDCWCTIPNGINTSSFNKKVRAATPPDGFNTDGPVFLSIGRYVPEKRQQDLIDAMSYLSGGPLDAQAVIVGYGPLEEKLKDQVKARGLEETVIIAGESSAVERYYALADVFVISSVVEGFPVVGLEAMAAELPIVGTSVPGVEDLIIDGQTGFLVPSRSPKQLADAMSAFDSKEVYHRMGQRGFERVQRFFDIENTVDGYLSLYQDVLSENGS